MTTPLEARFNQDYQKLLQHLTLKGLQPKTIDAYSRAIRRIGNYFSYHVYDLTEQQLVDFFVDLRSTHSWSTVKLDLYGLKFFYLHVLNVKWRHIDLIKSPRVQKLPNIVTVEQAAKIFMTTRVASYRVFFFVVYSLGLRISEALHLQVGDIDGQRMRVHIRDSKGNKDRFVPLPAVTLDTLRRFWAIHRNPVFLFPNRKGGLAKSRTATTHLDQVGVSLALGKVVVACGIKKRSPCIPGDIVTRHI
ncbi:MAG: site-specific integrase [Psychromonas sp.]